MSGNDWPVLDEDALYGLPGDVVRAIGPETEADPVALLATYLAFFGNAAGTGPHVRIGARYEMARINPVLVGETAKSRKGQSKAEVIPIFEEADPEWARDCVGGGLSTGEGLIWNLRDPEEDDDPTDVGDKPKRLDSGVSEKRAMVVAEELSRVLAVIRKDGSILSEVLREAHDLPPHGALSSRTKNAPYRATGAHVSMLGHITTDELRRRLADADIANGLANRWQFYLVKRSGFLPLGGRAAAQDLARLSRITRTRAEAARGIGEVQVSAPAEQAWTDLYRELLDDDPPGLLGALLARGSTHVLRLALIYALTDGSSTIGLDHLSAAWELWSYSVASARHIFASATGNPVAEKLAAAIEVRGAMSHAEQYDHFSRHVPREVLDEARALLLLMGRIGEREEATGGRPRKVNYPSARLREKRDMRGKSGKEG